MTTTKAVHLRSLAGGSSTLCGRGRVTLSVPITDDPAEVTCGNCRRVYGATGQDPETTAPAAGKE